MMVSHVRVSSSVRRIRTRVDVDGARIASANDPQNLFRSSLVQSSPRCMLCRQEPDADSEQDDGERGPKVKTAMKHPTYDLQHWTRLFPLDRSGSARNIPRPWWNQRPVYSPSAIALDEQVRQAIWPHLPQTPRVPCDLFTWAWGEPEDRTITKVGGIPFMDEADPWPCDGKGNPMGFVTQINFEDSTDLVGELPGKILLFFSQVEVVRNDRAYLDYSEAPTSYCFKWIDPDLVAAPLRSSTSDPLRLWPLHGCIYRSFDVPPLDYWSRAFADHDAPADSIYENGFPPAIWWSTKIGGVPHWEQGEDLGMTPPSGTFLCQILSDRSEERYPYIGKSSFSASEQAVRLHRGLVLGDVGSAYLFLVDGSIHFCSQS